MRFAALLICAPLFAQPPAFLLSDEVVPKRHTIDMTIDPSKDAYEGVSKIEVDIKKPASVVWINAKDITPLEATVGRQKAKAEVAGGEFIGLHLDSPASGSTTITIRFRAKLDEKAIVGAYRKKVGDDWYVFTSFTPIDARRAFPCFDEPRFKTPWEMTIHVKRTDRAFANGKEMKEIDEPNHMKAVHFARTEPLGAEVVAFAVGPFDTTETVKAGHGTPIRVIAPRGHAPEGKMALDATVDVLPRLEAYTGIPYPFGKLDHLADPEFPFGATENPGLIVYRMQSLLTSPGDGAEKLRRIRGVESHEMAHQWFGDMVTQATWDDVWLSEGFATWLSAKIMDEYETPARKHLSAVAARERIIATDQSSRTRPVRRTMHSRDDTKDVYSQMVYQKGGAILLMLDGWLGEDRMQKALRSYLKAHQFGNASTADLESAIGKDAAPVMDSFLNQTGVPSISAEVRCNQTSATVAIRTESHNVIPVCVRANGIDQTCSTAREIALKSCPAWTYFNSGATGYYRTEWTADQLKSLDISALTPAERLMLVFDLRAMKDRLDVAPYLSKLAADPEPEIAKAVTEGVPTRRQ
ncbi:MAG: M1 family metallopeptidase [Acidobacteriia bacterium]|nr:M1 family metallopeptidase [Terriglobia bacterium]